LVTEARPGELYARDRFSQTRRMNPGLATLWTAWQKFMALAPPPPLPLSLTGLGALAINLSCAFMLARFRVHSGSLTRAAFLSARNDAIANVAIIAAGLSPAEQPSG
jgi:Co/Zn/Cd efflux system component